MKNEIHAYPFLLGIPNYYNLYLSIQLDYASYLFNDDDSEAGFEKLAEIKQTISESDIELNHWYKESYTYLLGNIASYYFREKDYSAALEWVEKGLKTNPNSNSLQNKKKYIEEKM